MQVSSPALAAQFLPVAWNHAVIWFAMCFGRTAANSFVLSICLYQIAYSYPLFPDDVNWRTNVTLTLTSNAA